MVRMVLTNGSKRFFNGVRGNERKIREESTKDGGDFITYFEGDKGNERKIREEYEKDGGFIIDYAGRKGSEHFVQVTWPDNTTKFFDGIKGSEHLVRVTWPDGSFQIYEGDQGKERLVRYESNDRVEHYSGEPNKEALQRIDWKIGDIDKSYYDKEGRLTKAEKDNNMYYYDETERLKHIDYPNGDRQFVNANGELQADRLPASSRVLQRTRGRLPPDPDPD